MFAEPEIAARLLAKLRRGSRTARGTCPRRTSARCATPTSLPLRAALGDADFERAVAEGNVMGVGEAVSCALAFATRHG